MEPDYILNLFKYELEAAERKFKTFPIDPLHASAILAEEAGELQQAALKLTYEQGTWHHMREEAIQVGAMALRFLLNIEHMKCRPSEQVERVTGIVQQRKEEICPACLGDGIHPQWRHGSVDDCPKCGGTGKLSPVA